MRRLSWFLLLIVAVGVAAGQEDISSSPDQQNQSLGDLARALRAKKKTELPIITNDNFSQLPQLIRQTERLDVAGDLNALAPQPARSSAEPQVTCSVSFNAQGSGSSAPPAGAAPQQQDLPVSELSKLDGPAVLSADTLQVSMYNGSKWNVQEITVGLTIVKRSPIASLGTARLMPASTGPIPAVKKPDITVLYHLKGAAPPLTTTAFRQTVNVNLGPDDEWHWALLQARGIPPQ